jgi:hypothetical protein
VIDVTNPRFAVPDDPATVRGLHDAFIEGERRRRRIPQFITRMMLGAAAKQSRLARALFNSDDGFLDGMTTYVMKLGADNLVPPYDTLIDRRLAASPLEGLDIDVRCHDYDWDQPPLLKCLVERLTSAGAIIAASSEGALFEYGSAQAIVANLQVLRANGMGVCLVAGSVTCADETRRRMIAETRFKLVPRGVAGFAPLVARAGFRIAKIESALLSDQLLLRVL